MSININSLAFSIDQQSILENISFESKGITALLGQNGAGKSSLMKIITGYQSPTSGQVMVDGINVIENPLKAQKVMGYLPENNPLYLDLYVVEYLEQVAQLRNIPKEKVTEIIYKTGLQVEAHKKIRMLSKGYKQRVGLAQAILHNPTVLILDEPTTGLDPNQIIDIRNVIIELGKEKTILLSTHILQEVEAICNQIILLHKGKIVLNDTVTSILEQYESVEKAFYHFTHNS